jgi:hypothetical protein
MDGSMFTGKRIARFRIPKQLRCDELMVKTIALLAAEDCRDLSREILFLIDLGIQHRQHCIGKAPEGTLRPISVTPWHSGVTRTETA